MVELNNFTCFTLRTDALLFLLNVFADTLVVKAPHQTERSIKLVEQLDYSRNLDFSFADRWLIFAKVIYSWPSSCTFQNKHLVAFCNCFRSYFGGESASSNRNKCQIGGKLGWLLKFTFFICGQMAYICRT